MWAREFKNEAGVRDGAKESQRWLESYQSLAEQARQMPQTRLANVPAPVPRCIVPRYRTCGRTPATIALPELQPIHGHDRAPEHALIFSMVH